MFDFLKVIKLFTQLIEALRIKLEEHAGQLEEFELHRFTLISDSVPHLLAMSGDKRRQTLQHAINWYKQANDDCLMLEGIRETFLFPADYERFSMRWRRHRNQICTVLTLLGVNQHDVNELDDLDTDLFQVDSYQPTIDPDKHQRVFEMLEPAFTWTLNEQDGCEPGSVVVYTLVEDAEQLIQPAETLELVEVGNEK